MSLQPADYFAHLSNLLLLVSYSVRDILWLRWFAVAAAFIVMPYYLMQPTVLWPPLFWGSIFAIINLYQIAHIYAERRPVVLSAEEQRLYDLAFASLRPREFVALSLVGEWRDAEAGHCVLRQGENVAYLCIAIAGEVQVSRGERVLGAIPPGHIMGTAFAMVGQPSPVDAKFTGSGRYMCWPIAGLLAFMERRPELRATLHNLASHDLARKVDAMMARQLQ
ncbi:MAG TPA: hypothetical protein VKB34_12940 [Povalibacter sp.]|nr:hypothetical protein [Povalibacter sp.]